MEYITQINSFWRFRQLHKLSEVHISLYFSLLQAANEEFWKMPFSVSNTKLLTMSSIKENQLHKARKKLISLGLITFLPGTREQPGSYTIVSLYDDKGSVNGSNWDLSNNGSSTENTYTSYLKNNFFNKTESNPKGISDKTDTNENNEYEVLPNNNTKTNINTKTKTNTAVNVSNCEIIDYYKSTTKNLVTNSIISDIDIFHKNGIDNGLVIRLIDFAISMGKGNWNYIRSAVNGCIKKSIFTVEQYEKNEQERMKSFDKPQQINKNVPKSKFNNFTSSKTYDDIDYDEIILNNFLESLNA